MAVVGWRWGLFAVVWRDPYNCPTAEDSHRLTAGTIGRTTPMSEAMVSPSVMSWARRRRGVAVDELANRLNVKPDTVLAWESGDRLPTFRQAEGFAQALYIPFGYLYLLEPPAESMPLADFRSSPGHSGQDPSPDLLDLLNDVLGKQQWFREYRLSEGVEELPFVGSFNTTDPEKEVAANIREVIGVDRARQLGGNWEAFMRLLTRNAEGCGIMVMRSGVVGNNNHRPLDVEEFRGFSISDDIAPLIFINVKDFRSAQFFTLAHELAHIWTVEGGVCNPNYGLNFGQQDSDVEQFCNRVAAETLVPGDDFRSRWEPDSEKVDTNLQVLSRHYRVSTMVILRQAYDQEFLSAATYRDLFSRMVAQVGRRQRPGEGGGNFHLTLTARNGAAFTEAVVSSAAGGTLLSSEAADLLGVKVKSLPGVAEHLFGSPLTLA